MLKFTMRKIIKTWKEKGINFAEVEGINYIIEVEESDIINGYVECL